MAISAFLKQRSSVSSWSPEQQLILACSRVRVDPASLNDKLDQFEAHLDWHQFIQIATWHGIIPLVYRNLSQWVPHRVPKPVLSQLLSLYLANSSHNQLLTLGLTDLVAQFDRHDIPVIAFKGPVLAAVIYGNTNLRRFSDIDLLVQEKDILRTRELLIDQKFHPNRLANPQETDHYLRSQTWDDTFTNVESSVTIDLHCQLTPDYFPVPFDLEQIWSSREAFTIHKTQVYSFNSEDLLLYLCVHGSKELWRNLLWICDVSEVVRACPDLPWSKLLDRAQALGIERMFLLGMMLAHDLLNSPMPAPLEARISAYPVIAELTEIFEKRLFCDLETVAKNGKRGFWLFHNPLHLKLRDHWRDRLPQYWLTLRFAITPNDEDEQFLVLPQILYPLYYFIRPIRILVKWILTREDEGEENRKKLNLI